MNTFKPILISLCLSILALRASAATFTNLFFSTTNTTTVTTAASVTIQSNQLGRVVYARFSNPGPRVNVRVGGAKFAYNYSDLAGTNSSLGYYGPGGPPTVAGPAVIELEMYLGTPAGHFLCVVEVTDTNPSFVPSNAVVIPSDGAGPVEIILESSTDLITWTPALPGTYGTSTEKRFFRVRAQRAP